MVAQSPWYIYIYFIYIAFHHCLYTWLLQRPLWRHYYQYVDGIVMVLDSNDRERLSDVSRELNLLLGEEQLHGMPLLLLANKQDLPNAMMREEIVERLHLNNLTDRTWCESYVCEWVCIPLQSECNEYLTLVWEIESSVVW